MMFADHYKGVLSFSKLFVEVLLFILLIGCACQPLTTTEKLDSRIVVCGWKGLYWVPKL